MVTYHLLFFSHQHPHCLLLKDFYLRGKEISALLIAGRPFLIAVTLRFLLMRCCCSKRIDVVTFKRFSSLVILVCCCIVLQEAVSTGDPEMVQLVLQRRDYLKAYTALGGVPGLLSKIREVCFHIVCTRVHYCRPSVAGPGNIYHQWR